MRKTVLFAGVLIIPMLVFHLNYLFNHVTGLEPTGFIQYDNVSYVAYGKQYLDAGKFHLQYSNPFNDSNEYEPIYFQTQFLFFALLIKSGLPPGWIMIPFSLICSLICFILVIRIYDLLVTDKKNRTLNIWLFAWGGGLLSLAGIITHFVLQNNIGFTNNLLLIDPEKGWWGLNLGRSLFFTCEAYYHALFLGCIYTLLRKKWIASAILLFLLSASHPFTGLELAGIICAWCAFEFIYDRKNIPFWFITVSILILSFHLYYYLYYLEQFPDHRSVREQYTLEWKLRYYRMIPAYIIVGSLAVATIFQARVKKFISIRSNRIFLSWFAVAFLLINHELFMEAKQPVHFSRGYVWTSLFLLGLPALQKWNGFLKHRWGKWAVFVFVFFFFLDNFSWIMVNSTSRSQEPNASYVTGEQRSIFKKVDEQCTNHTLIISSDNAMAYLATVYTKAYPWHSHIYTTPFAQKKLDAQNLFLENGIIDSAWKNRDIIFILRKQDSTGQSAIDQLNARKIITTRHYEVSRLRLDSFLVR